MGNCLDWACGSRTVQCIYAEHTGYEILVANIPTLVGLGPAHLIVMMLLLMCP